MPMKAIAIMTSSSVNARLDLFRSEFRLLTSSARLLLKDLGAEVAGNDCDRAVRGIYPERDHIAIAAEEMNYRGISDSVGIELTADDAAADQTASLNPDVA